jgi:hypothetical protein
MGEQPTSTVPEGPAVAWVVTRPWRLWRPLWRRGERLGGWLFHLGALALMHLVTGGGYMVLLRISDARGVTVWDPGTALDKAIPTVGWTIFPYVSYYGYGVLTVLATPRNAVGRHRLIVLYQGLIAMTLVVFSFFLLMPSEIYLVRDVPAELLTGQGVVPAIFRWLQAVDRPWNAWPSHHACISLVTALYVVRTSRNPAARLAMWVAWGLLALSIVTTKQHFLFDLVTGVALGWGTWHWVVRRPLAAADGRPWGPAGRSRGGPPEEGAGPRRTGP